MLIELSELLRLLSDSVDPSSGPLLGWPRGRVTLTEKEAAEAIGVQAYVLRDARLRLKLAHTVVGRTIVYRPEQLKAALDLMAAHF